jgi:CheY-like chemotaxis protein
MFASGHGKPNPLRLMMHHNTVRTEPTANTSRLFAPTSRILVADADDDTRALYSQSFQLSGCHVVEASDGRDALAKALASPPSLVVTEVRLPFLSGYALCEILRRDRATAHVPILVVTAEARPAEMERARKAGADIVVAKPTTPDDILSLSRRLLGEVEELRGREAATEASADAQCEISEHASAHSGERGRGMLVKAHSRFATTTPPTPPRSLICPSCDSPLTYNRSHIGGVSYRQPEQWDYYTCVMCGAFQYRQRTRKLRRVDPVP